MTYKYLFIFVEGKDDKEFFERIIKPKLNIKYDTIQIVEYSNLSDKKINELIKSINSYADYIFITDNDNCPCKITKENFIRLQKPFFDSIIDFRQEILHLFDFETAKQNNASFKYFVDKYIA